MSAPEVRTFEFRMTDIDTTDALSYLEGRAVPYGTEEMVGWYWEQFEPAVFSESIAAQAPLPLLLWHNGRHWPIGVTEEWTEDDDGLHGVWRLDADPDAQRAARMARDGFMTGLSVGFDPRTSKWTYTPADQWNPDDSSTYDHVVRQTARLVETSLVPAPAYNDAQVTLVRSAARHRHGMAARRAVAPTRRASLPAAPSTVPTPHLDYWRAVRATLNPH